MFYVNQNNTVYNILHHKYTFIDEFALIYNVLRDSSSQGQTLLHWQLHIDKVATSLPILT